MSHRPGRVCYWMSDYFAGLVQGGVGDHSGTSIDQNATLNIEWLVPCDFSRIIELTLGLIVKVGAGSAAADIDLYSEYGSAGQDYDTHTASSVGTTYDLSSFETLIEINAAPIYTLITAGDQCGLQVDQNAVGRTVLWVGLHLRYLAK